MREKRTPRRTWKELEATEKLGYAWVAIYFLLILATALTILIPAYTKWQLEHQDEKSGLLDRRPVGAFASNATEDPTNGTLRTDRLPCEARSLSKPAGLG